MSHAGPMVAFVAVCLMVAVAVGICAWVLKTTTGGRHRR